MNITSKIILLACLSVLSVPVWARVLPGPADPGQLAALTEQFRETQVGVPVYRDQGEEICFTWSDGLYVMNADGTNKHRIVATSSAFPGFYTPCWSLDGNHIAFNAVYYSGGVMYSNIVVCDAEGQNPTVIYTQILGYSYNLFQSLSWSPDNQYIMFNYAYNDYQFNDYYTNCIINLSGTYFWFDGDFPDCGYSQWDPNDQTRRAMVTYGWGFDWNTRLRWRRLDGSSQSIWLIVQDAIAALAYCSWYNSSNIYTVLKDGSLVGYPNRQVMLRVTSSAIYIVAYSDQGASLHSPSFSPSRQYLLLSEFTTTTSTIYKTYLPTGSVYSLGWGAYPDWRQQIPGIEETAGHVSDTRIEMRCQPNPFRDQAVISFKITESSPVSLSVYDASGREVASLLNDVLSAGQHTIQWRPAHLPQGIYILKMETRTGVQTVRLTYLK